MHKTKKILLGLLFAVITLSSSSLVVYGLNNQQEVEEQGILNLPSFYNTIDYFHSNKYSNVENNIIVNNQYEIDGNDELLLTNEAGTYYVNKKTLSLKFKDNSGYIHNTTVNQYDGETRVLNNTNYGIASSAVVVYYYDYGNNGATLQPESMVANSESKLKSFNKTADGFEAVYFYGLSGVELKIIVKIDKDSFTITVPSDSIVEHYANYNEKPKVDYRLGAIDVYSYFGGVNSNKINGYNFIPDGTGALIRYHETSENPYNDYRKNIYGTDIAKSTSGVLNATTSEISMPVYGYVHGINQHGMLAIIESGAENAAIVATQSSRNFPFYRVYPEFQYRHNYVQPMSSTGASINLTQADKEQFDVQIKYQFLKNEKANYVGMANSYKQYLIGNNMMNNNNHNYQNIPLRVDTIGQEVTKGSLFNKHITMTTFKQYADIIKDIKDNGVENVFGVYKGYSKDGTTWASPVYKNIAASLGSINSLDLDNTYFYLDSTKAHEKQTKYTNSKYVGKKINSQLITEKSYGDQYYYLNQETTVSLLESNMTHLSQKGINKFAVGNLGSTLYSTYGKKGLTRQETATLYSDKLSSLEKEVALYRANDYMLKHISRNLDFSMFSSQLLAFDDTVPFSSIVMSGNIELYSTYINFFANARDDLLRMIEFDVYPSFLITNEASSLLDETSMNYIYASKYDDYKEAINVYYDFVNNALKHVIGSNIVNREVIKQGLVKIEYSNNVKIIVNYLNNDETYLGQTVKAKNYLVIEG